MKRKADKCPGGSDLACQANPHNGHGWRAGVTALGHRRLLLRAIAALDNVEKRTPTNTTAAPEAILKELGFSPI
jgi:hypothetical protein